MERKSLAFGVLIVACLCCTIADASAQMRSSAIALILAPSVRAGGMGRASNAVFWGGDPDCWANPAALSYYHGVRYEHGRTQLVPDFFDDVFFTTDRVSLGARGIGISMVGDPFRALGETKLDYGEIPIVMEGPDGGIEIGVYSPYEIARSFSIGAGLLELGGRLIDALGYDGPDPARFAEISVGYTRKSYRCDLGPEMAEYGLDRASAAATTYDRGILLRLTPYNSLDHEGFFPKVDSAIDHIAGGLRLDIGFGSSLQNYNGVVLHWSEGSESSVSKVARDGWSLHADAGMPSGLRRFLEDHGLGLLAESLTPLLSWGKAWDRLNPITSVPGSDRVYAESEIEQSGWELDVAGIYAVRRGRVDSPDGQIHGDTSGWSVGFRLAGIGGFRYDKATVPQSVTMGPVEPKGYTVYVDPLALWRMIN